MPTYSYSCSHCENEWEQHLSVSDCRKPLKTLSACCDAQVHRVFKVPRVISDDLGLRGVWNPADGRTYDSRAAYHRAVKENGCEIIDDGYKPRQKPEDKSLREDIAQAYRQHS